jgi:hypothetical protein
MSGKRKGGWPLPPVLAPLMVIVVVLFWQFATKSIQSAIPDHGDWWSDMETFRAAKRLDQTGFVANKFTIPLDDGVRLGTDPALYVNWPSGATLVNGLLLRLGFGIYGLRLVSLIVAGVAAMLFYFFVLHVSGKRTAALASAAYIVTLAPFRLLADSLTYMAWEWLGRCLCLLTCVKLADLATDHPHVRRLQLLVGLGPLLCLSFLGLELLPGSLFFGTLYASLFAPIGERWRRFFRVWIPLAVGTILGIIVRALHVRWVTGSFQAAKDRLVASGGHRLGAADTTDSFLSVWSMRMVLYFGPLLLVLAIATIPTIRKNLKQAPFKSRLVNTLVLLLVADVLWPIVARQHSAHHTHTAMHLFFSTSLLFGLLVAAGSTERGPRLLVLRFIACLSVGVNLFVMPLSTRGNLADNLAWGPRQNMAAVLGSAIPEEMPIWLKSSETPDMTFFIDRPYSMASKQPEKIPLILTFSEKLTELPRRLLAEQWGNRLYSVTDGLSLTDINRNVDLDLANVGVAPGGAQGYEIAPNGSVTFRFDNTHSKTEMRIALTSSKPVPTARFVIDRSGPGVEPVKLRVAADRGETIIKQSVPIPFGTEQTLKISVHCDDVSVCDSAKFGFGYAVAY